MQGPYTTSATPGDDLTDMPGLMTLWCYALMERLMKQKPTSTTNPQLDALQDAGLTGHLRFAKLAEWWKFNPRNLTLFFRRKIRLSFYNPGPGAQFVEVSHITPRVSRWQNEADALDVIPHTDADLVTSTFGPCPSTATPVPSIQWDRAFMNAFWSEAVLVTNGINTPFTKNGFAIGNWGAALRRMAAPVMMPGAAFVGGAPFYGVGSAAVTNEPQSHNTQGTGAVVGMDTSHPPVRVLPKATIGNTNTNYTGASHAPALNPGGLLQELGTAEADVRERRFNYLYSAQQVDANIPGLTYGDATGVVASSANINWCDYSNAGVPRFTDDTKFSFSFNSILKRFFKFQKTKFWLPAYGKREVTITIPVERCNLMHSRFWPYLPFFCSTVQDTTGGAAVNRPNMQGMPYTQSVFNTNGTLVAVDAIYGSAGCAPRAITSKRIDGWTQHWLQIRHYGQMAINNQANAIVDEPSMQHSSGSIMWRMKNHLNWKLRDRARYLRGRLGKYERRQFDTDNDPTHYAWTKPPFAPTGVIGVSSGASVPSNATNVAITAPLGTGAQATAVRTTNWV